MIKLKCKKCNYSFEVSEIEFKEHPETYIECFVRCGGSNTIVNVEVAATMIIEQEVKANIDKWFNILGLEGTIELIERHKDQEVCYRLYKEELKRRGFNIK